jgi:hypothetical protein
MEINVVNFEIQPLVEMDTLPLIILWIPYKVRFLILF